MEQYSRRHQCELCAEHQQLCGREYECEVVVTNSSTIYTSAPVTLQVVLPPVQNRVWGSAMGITDDANLLTAGKYFDAFLPNTSAGFSLIAAGIIFNRATSS